MVHGHCGSVQIHTALFKIIIQTEKKKSRRRGLHAPNRGSASQDTSSSIFCRAFNF